MFGSFGEVRRQVENARRSLPLAVVVLVTAAVIEWLRAAGATLRPGSATGARAAVAEVAATGSAVVTIAEATAAGTVAAATRATVITVTEATAAGTVAAATRATVITIAEATAA
ncbi:MAG: hypothetical protein Q7T55_22865, partial [Solirubrobacteraceae bacterium]|nr:hypothetical protein [Solirubrobacteraceae bacterium]